MEKIVRNYLEIKSINQLIEKKKPNKNFFVEKVFKTDFQLNKFFYKQIGKNHQWKDRLAWTDKQWIEYVSNKNVTTYVLKENNSIAGFFELIHHKDKSEVEIAYLGLLEEYIKKRLGGYMLTEAIQISFKKSVKRVWVHTCSLDHKNALQNYISRGMKIYNSESLSVKSA
tara:strand:+ start:9 stop:518 length:510 start_codon:yes stop_codon:yes gene_type:complete